jgi:nucleolar pre-ribosomal-associated protein 1
VSLPVPLSSFMLPGAASYYSSPPPLSTILENILPSVNLKTHLSKGLQSPSGLVRHCTAIALAKCLVKLEETLRIFSDVAKALGEDEEGQWMTRQHELEHEARRRVPEFQVVVAYSQLSAIPEEVDSGSNTTKTALLAESAQRVLWMYHRCLPEVVAEARFDIGKLLSNFMEGMEGGGYPLEQQSPLDAAARLHIARKLHIIRLLQESDQFAWSAKMGASMSD